MGHYMICCGIVGCQSEVSCISNFCLMVVEIIDKYSDFWLTPVSLFLVICRECHDKNRVLNTESGYRKGTCPLSSLVGLHFLQVIQHHQIRKIKIQPADTSAEIQRWQIHSQPSVSELGLRSSRIRSKGSMHASNTCHRHSQKLVIIYFPCTLSFTKKLFSTVIVGKQSTSQSSLIRRSVIMQSKRPSKES